MSAIIGSATVRSRHEAEAEGFRAQLLAKGEMHLVIDGTAVVVWPIRDIAPSIESLRGTGGELELTFKIPVL